MAFSFSVALGGAISWPFPAGAGCYNPAPMSAGLIFGDESDTVRAGERDVFVYAFVRLSYRAYEDVQAEFGGLKRALRVAGEVKWTKTAPHRAAFLGLLARHAPEVEVRYWVADKRRFKSAKADRYRFKTLEAAFSSLFPFLPGAPLPLVLLDERHANQDREEAGLLRALGVKWRTPLPPCAYLSSQGVIGLQLADLVAGAVRARESRADATWEIIKECTRRFEV